MNLNKIALVTGLVVGINIAMLPNSKSLASTIITQNANLATPPSGAFVIGECIDAGLCNPGDILSLDYSVSSSVYAKNDSAYNFTKFIYTILPGQDAFWDASSAFNFLGTTEISSNGKILTFSGGLFASGATAFFSSVVNPSGGIPIQVNVTFEGTAVPEPLNILGATTGLALFGTISNALKKRKVSK